MTKREIKQKVAKLEQEIKKEYNGRHDVKRLSFLVATLNRYGAEIGYDSKYRF